MARYRKIDPRIWNDEKFSALSHEAQRMFFFCLTHPSMTALGAFRITKSGMAEELGLSGKGFAEPFGELFRKGLVNYDERAFLLFVPNFLKYNAPENPNVVRGWVSSLDLLPECHLKTQVLARARACTADNDALSKAFDKAFGRVADTLSEGLGELFSKGMPKQEQEQEQEQEYIYRTASQYSSLPEAETSSIASDEKVDQVKVPYEKIVDLYNEMCAPSCVKCMTLSPARKVSMRQRAIELMKIWDAKTQDEILECFRRIFQRVQESDFLMGRTQRNGNHSNFRVDLSWILKAENMTKILEEKYA